ncbi:MAG: sulfurtransferase TusA family protein [Candidatus Methanoperedens sp.]|nr:sulfurtransferase TusA family protein [Candidatus Methanoperedens sp.]CAG1001281.1 Putative sulfur carrier protein [Methanosarcinales archaeon]
MECLDLQGKVCPFVLFYTKKKLEKIPVDEKLEVIANDPTAKETISGWCKAHHHEILEIKDMGTHIKIIILKH